MSAVRARAERTATAGTPHVLARRTSLARIALVLAAIPCCLACKPKASAAQCDNLLERYAGLVVTAKYPDASAEQIQAERDREKGEARSDDSFKNCSSQVSQAEFECAMHAPNADAFEKCLE
jgi:hypothetical protein